MINKSLNILLNSFKEKNGRFPIIAVEGIDCSGKSTISKKLADILCGCYIHTPAREFSEIKSIFETNDKYYLARFYFYLSSLLYSYHKNAEILRKQPIVFDRYILSTKVYHLVLLRKLGIKNSDMIINSALYPPSADINIILKINAETAQQRIRNRKTVHFDVRIENNLEIQNNVMKKFLECKEFTVETDFMDVQQVFEKCLNHIIRFIENQNIIKL